MEGSNGEPIGNAPDPESRKQEYDPYQRPPDSIRNVYKRFQKMDRKTLDGNSEIIDFGNGLSDEQKGRVVVVNYLKGLELDTRFESFIGGSLEHRIGAVEVPVYEFLDMPGLQIIPALLPATVQTTLLSRLLHRDLSNPVHLTNIHTHYTLTYPPSSRSFFSLPPSTPNSPSPTIAHPKDPHIHAPLSSTPLLTKKIRWVTLGGQYDWTLKQYPPTAPPPFPPDIKDLLEGIFPATKAEAAIVNLYSPGDTLSMHRDVAERVGNGLVSVSLGCEGIFVIGNDDAPNADDQEAEKDRNIAEADESCENETARRRKAKRPLVLRLRSGDIIHMSGSSRFAWHGVPQILKSTCPPYLQPWPAPARRESSFSHNNNNSKSQAAANHEEDEEEEDFFEPWRSWMANKRINLNVRQMFA